MQCNLLYRQTLGLRFMVDCISHFKLHTVFKRSRGKKTDALRNLIHCERHFFLFSEYSFFQPKILFFWLLIWKWIELKSEIHGIDMSFGRNISEEKSKWKNLNKIAFLIWIMVADTKKMGRGIWFSCKCLSVT